MSRVAIDYNNPVAVRNAGLDVLVQGLGPLGMAVFMLQFDSGYGNYTEEREELLKDITPEDIERELGAMV